MDKKTLKNIEELSTKAKELSEIEERIDELKGVKATYERENLIHKNAVADLKDNYQKEKKKLDDDIEFRKNIIKDLEQKQTGISSRHQAEIGQLQLARTSVEQANANMKSQEEKMSAKEKNIAKQTEKLEKTKTIIGNIAELAKQLI